MFFFSFIFHTNNSEGNFCSWEKLFTKTLIDAQRYKYGIYLTWLRLCSFFRLFLYVPNNLHDFVYVIHCNCKIQCVFRFFVFHFSFRMFACKPINFLNLFAFGENCVFIWLKHEHRPFLIPPKWQNYLWQRFILHSFSFASYHAAVVLFSCYIYLWYCQA